MSTPSALVRPSGVPLTHRLAARAVLPAARLLSRLPPQRIRSALALVRRGAAAATPQQAQAARDAMCAVSLMCAGPQGCLPRSLGTALLCRLWGVWPTWCTGVRVVPPFAAHAWVEVDGRLVGEAAPDDYFTRLLVVAPARRDAS
ncbi:lasso peptide biosynthesis B2 protein [Streptomyces gilvosporeus]|uniref:Polyketide beta-ketoacyl synthase n=1 Tax=Streptomyces gilvosporeus TaxID=553510 RepID=A0A1V0TJH7_9ACTN|nr:lasso peptide biosynthesis B2 protein [Streptomyces gilvosporeus]ARF53079.1 polyketide beta-ketoacyl synthase [Streptomyces gilvosporeus]